MKDWLKYALAIALLSFQAKGEEMDGGIKPWPREIDYKCPAAPPLKAVDGGYFLSEERAQRLNCHLAACESHRDGCLTELENNKPPKSWLLIVVVILTGGVAGFLVGKAIR